MGAKLTSTFSIRRRSAGGIPNATGSLAVVRLARLAVPLLLASALLACDVVVSKAPLAPPNDAAPEPRAVGVWDARLCGDKKGETKCKLAYRVYVRRDSGFVYEILAVRIEHPGRWTLFRGHGTQIGGYRIGNLLLVADGEAEADGRTDPRIGSYLLVDYRFDGLDHMRVRLLSAAPFAAAIKSNRLTGSVKVGDFTTNLTIDDTSDRIAAVLTAADPDSLFEDYYLELARRKTLWRDH